MVPPNIRELINRVGVVTPRQSVFLLLLMLFARTSATWLGIDALTTVTFATPLTVGVGAFLGVIVIAGLVAARQRSIYAAVRDPLSTANVIAKPAQFVFACLAFGAAAVWLVCALLGVLAQHTDGRELAIEAKVVDIYLPARRKVNCRLRLTVLNQASEEKITFCAATTNLKAKELNYLNINDELVVRLKETIFGGVVISFVAKQI